MTRGKFRLQKLAIALAALALAQAGVSLSLRLGSLHRALLTRLEHDIGRPVEVGRFNFSLWKPLRLEAHYITVQDDPEFGAEFLLRADRLDAALDGRALLRGALVFSRLALERPSLNLVRAASGRWNFEPWAVARSAASGKMPAAFTGPARLSEITIENGRINFKRGPEKLPFALVEVSGDLSADAAGAWHIMLTARPFRAGVTLQDGGAFRLEGRLPAVATAAQASAPAEFSAQWQKAALSDALRLIFGRDFGVRGRMESSLLLRKPPPEESPVAAKSGDGSPLTRTTGPNAATFPAAWAFSGVLRLSDVHRWDLPLAPRLPALNLSLRGTGSADRHRWECTDILLEGPRSHLRGQASYNRDALPQTSLRVVTAGIHLDDLLMWYRAFHPGVAPGVSVEGYLGADVELEAWPPAFVRAALATTGARLMLPDGRPILWLRRAVLEADRGGARVRETSLALRGDEPGVRFSAQLRWDPGLPFTARFMGGSEDLADLFPALAALGLAPSPHPLVSAGSVSLHLNASGSAWPWRFAPQGSMVFENAKLSGGLLRSELEVGRARLDFLPGQRRLELSAWKAFGGTWSGTLTAPRITGPWQFRLAVDRVNPALLLGGFSSARPEDSSLLSLILPAPAAATVAREELRWPDWLRGEGTISTAALSIGRLEFERVRGRLSIGERSIALEGAEATLAGGRVRGEARAIFGEQPAYSVRAEFDGLNVAALSALAEPTRHCCSGTANGRVELSAAGWNRDALLASLKGQGSARIRSAALLTLDLPATLARERAVPGGSSLRELSGEFTLANSHAWLDRVSLDLPAEHWEAAGNVDFHGQLDIRLSPVMSGPSPQPTHDPRVQLKGALAAPQIVPLQIPPR